MLGALGRMHDRRGARVGRWRARAAFAVALLPGAFAVDAALPASPLVLTTTASAGAAAGEVFATATLAGGDDPTGTVTFRLFGPGDDTCGRAPVFTSIAPVTG